MIDRPRRGRPPTHPIPRDSRVQLRLTREQKSALVALAQVAGRTLNDEIIARCLPTECPACGNGVLHYTYVNDRGAMECDPNE